MNALMTSSSVVAPQDITLHPEPPIAGSPPHSISNTMSFVKLSIFGTSFEVILLSFSHFSAHSSIYLRSLRDMSIYNPSAWVRHFPLSLALSYLFSCRCVRAGMVRSLFFDLVFLRQLYIDAYIVQLCEGSTYRRVRRHKKNHETLQHSRPI